MKKINKLAKYYLNENLKVKVKFGKEEPFNNYDYNYLDLELYEIIQNHNVKVYANKKDIERINKKIKKILK